ncbi:ribonuclease D [Litorivivens lipolytica]|uniref:Ribonuclease D n=1 Tax=Litorivivens lipolytica TaxID=1524264 RepID=A0A7W4W3K8_9GAMM|nr:ribonuclease D [Litorivivens lipolytica]MBB3046513.1 ribonuclease D [Litorivivens lipolytica]
MSVDYQYIDSDAVLETMCQQLAQAEVLALDTEFMRTDTFYPIPALLQLSDGEAVYLVDPLAISDWQALQQLLTCASPVKVMHSVSEDFEVFQRLFGVVPRPLLDTQVGAALASLDSGMGYQRLVAELLDIEVDKGETRSNWLQRPLSDSQCLYAALDVVHLLPVYRKLQSILEESGRFGWWQEEGERQVNSAQPLAPEQYYQRVKSGWKLSASEQARLKALCTWRETEARERDVPRGRILKDALCVDVVRRQPQSSSDLSRLKDITPSIVRRFGDAICEAIEDVPPLTQNELLLPPPAGEGRDQMKSLRQQVDKLSETLGISRDVIMSKKLLEETVRQQGLPADYRGWRSELLADTLHALFGSREA